MRNGPQRRDRELNETVVGPRGNSVGTTVPDRADLEEGDRVKWVQIEPAHGETYWEVRKVGD